MADTIRRHGWFIQYLEGGMCDVAGCDCSEEGEVAVAYTVGLFGLGHPELLILGTDPHTPTVS